MGMDEVGHDSATLRERLNLQWTYAAALYSAASSVEGVCVGLGW